MLMQGRAGLVRTGDGSDVVARLGQQGEVMVSELHGRYYEQAARGKMAFAISLDRAMSLFSATAQIGLIVHNPVDSGVNLSLNKWAIQNTVTDADMVGVALCMGYQTTTPTTITAANSSGLVYVTQPTLTAGKAKAYAIATVLIARS